MEYDDAIAAIKAMDNGEEIFGAITARADETLNSYNAATESLNADISSLKSSIKDLQVENYKLMTMAHSGENPQGAKTLDMGDYKPLNYSSYLKKM